MHARAPYHRMRITMAKKAPEKCHPTWVADEKKFFRFVSLITMQSMMCANTRIHLGKKAIFACLRIATSLTPSCTRCWRLRCWRLTGPRLDMSQFLVTSQRASDVTNNWLNKVNYSSLHLINLWAYKYVRQRLILCNCLMPHSSEVSICHIKV